MLTFLPYQSFRKSAMVLDSKRLGKQRIEARQLLEAIGWRLDPEMGTIITEMRDDLPDKGAWVERWRSGPAAEMWEGYHWALASYYNAMVWEWIGRGYNSDMPVISFFKAPKCYSLPEWLGDEEFHSCQRANLLRKFPKHYEQFGWEEEPKTGYIWPTRV